MEMGRSRVKPLASLSLDLDNEWSYLKTHGDPGWKHFPSYLPEFIPYVLDLLDILQLRITFFIVGQDAALDEHRDVLSLLTERGHEVGNHSFSHEPWVHLSSKERIREEVVKAEDKIFLATGQKPVGFRGPGFSWTQELLEVLAESKYLYDASIFPSFLGPLARRYYFWKSDLEGNERLQRALLFGSFKGGLKSLKPFSWNVDSGKALLEIPVTTIPLFKTPFHLSYLLYLSRFSEEVMSFYLELALVLCRMTGTEPSFLLHPLDFIGVDEVPDLAFFPGINISKQRKKVVFIKVINMLSKHFRLVTMNEHAHSILKKRTVRVRLPHH